jgi:hypothetical protein
VCSTLFLRSGIQLELPHGCTLKAHTDLSEFPDLGEYSLNKDRQPYHLVAAIDCEDVGIVGRGTIDGDGFAFWDKPMRELAAEGVDIEAYCDEHDLNPVYRKANHPWWREHAKRISPLLELKGCKRVRLGDVTIANSPGWTVHMDCCDDVRIQGITIANHLYGPNTDGLDLNGCRDVIISDCDLTCGDDAIILKAMHGARSCERIAVSNCILASNCAALGLGAETVYPIRDISFTGCVVRQALRAVQIEMWEAGLIENVTVTGLTGTTLTEIPLQRALYVDIQHHGREDGALGTLRNVLFSNIALTTRGRCVFTAADGAVLEDVVLRDVHLTYPSIEDASVTVPTYLSSQMSNDAPETRATNAALVVDNARRFQVHNLTVTWPGEGSNQAGDADAIGELNPHNTDPAMHAMVFRRVRQGLVDAPFCTAYDPDGLGQVERVVAIDSELSIRD